MKLFRPKSTPALAFRFFLLAVLVTGSVVTAGDAQLLLAPAQAVGASANPGAPEPGTPARHSFTLGELS